MFRLAGVAQYSLPLFHAGVIPSLVLTLESPTYLSKFSNLNRVSHPQKIAGPSAKNQITVVVERPFTPSRNSLVWVGHSCPTPLTFLFHPPRPIPSASLATSATASKP